MTALAGLAATGTLGASGFYGRAGGIGQQAGGILQGGGGGGFAETGVPGGASLLRYGNSGYEDIFAPAGGFSTPF